jgi:hypothetical protein
MELKKVSVSFIRQLCQKTAVTVCEAVYQQSNQGLNTLLQGMSLEEFLFNMLNTVNSECIQVEIKDILNSIINSTEDQSSLKKWIELCKDIAISNNGALICFHIILAFSQIGLNF